MSGISFGQTGFPRRIESDPMFNAWSKSLPRLWYLDQRQATRLDAESLFGASQFAIFYGRAEFTTLADPIETALVGVRGYLRSQVFDLSNTGPFETGDRVVSYNVAGVPQVTFLDEPVQSVVVTKKSGGPVAPIEHPILGANPR